MRALLVEVDFSTGKRAGNINPRDADMPCHGWQNLDEGLEIRLVEDNRDLSQYETATGITVLGDTEAINKAIIANFPTKYIIKDKELLLAHLKEKGISLDIFTGKSMDDVAEELFKQGLAGIIERKPKLL